MGLLGKSVFREFKRRIEIEGRVFGPDRGTHRHQKAGFKVRYIMKCPHSARFFVVQFCPVTFGVLDVQRSALRTAFFKAKRRVKN